MHEAGSLQAFPSGEGVAAAPDEVLPQAAPRASARLLAQKEGDQPPRRLVEDKLPCRSLLHAAELSRHNIALETFPIYP